MTASTKIEEAEYNFGKMVRIDPLNKEFAFELSNFLCSARGILDHLISEHATKYGLTLHRIDEKRFRSMANKMNNNNALKFIDWYSDQVTQIKKDPACLFLMNARNLNVHRDQIKPRWTTGERVAFDRTDPNNIKLIPLGSWWFFEGYHNEDARTICREFLDKITTIVILAHSIF